MQTFRTQRVTIRQRECRCRLTPGRIVDLIKLETLPGAQRVLFSGVIVVRRGVGGLLGLISGLLSGAALDESIRLKSEKVVTLSA